MGGPEINHRYVLPAISITGVALIALLAGREWAKESVQNVLTDAALVADAPADAGTDTGFDSGIDTGANTHEERNEDADDLDEDASVEIQTDASQTNPLTNPFLVAPSQTTNPQVVFSPDLQKLLGQ